MITKTITKLFIPSFFFTCKMVHRVCGSRSNKILVGTLVFLSGWAAARGADATRLEKLAISVSGKGSGLLAATIGSIPGGVTVTPQDYSNFSIHHDAGHFDAAIGEYDHANYHGDEGWTQIIDHDDFWHNDVPIIC